MCIELLILYFEYILPNTLDVRRNILSKNWFRICNESEVIIVSVLMIKSYQGLS